MIHEIAHIVVKAGMGPEFERGADTAKSIFLAAQGCTSFRLDQVIEKPGRYRLAIGWRSIEDHMVAFRQSADFDQWRALVAHCFAKPPEVYHVRNVLPEVLA